MLWAELLAYAPTCANEPWLLMGDFNVIRRQGEAVGGSTSWPEWKGDLENSLREAELDDLRFNGNFLTWTNRREEEPIMRKLDRVVCNRRWEDTFPASEANFQPPLTTLLW
jgi:endonuclease/exonuclease/phosphatase family metal-dependent hydrolase